MSLSKYQIAFRGILFEVVGTVAAAIIEYGTIVLAIVEASAVLGINALCRSYQHCGLT